MTREELSNRYFGWLCGIVYNGESCSHPFCGYDRLLSWLHSTDFIVLIGMDQNRAEDGIDLRYQFGEEYGFAQPMVATYLDIVPCSVFEMMVALAFHCENIMSDPELGKQLDKWFWIMLENLGLKNMSDENFDEQYVRYIVYRFLNREYSSDGVGGLFTIENCTYDLRNVEIWHQMCWYLDSILNID